MRKHVVRVANRSGLHARPAALLVQVAKKFKSRIIIRKKGAEADAKNILQVLSLGVDLGDEIEIVIEGEDEEEGEREILWLIREHLPEIDK